MFVCLKALFCALYSSGGPEPTFVKNDFWILLILESKMYALMLDKLFDNELNVLLKITIE